MLCTCHFILPPPLIFFIYLLFFYTFSISLFMHFIHTTLSSSLSPSSLLYLCFVCRFAFHDYMCHDRLPFSSSSSSSSTCSVAAAESQAASTIITNSNANTHDNQHHILSKWYNIPFFCQRMRGGGNEEQVILCTPLTPVLSLWILQTFLPTTYAFAFAIYVIYR